MLDNKNKTSISKLQLIAATSLFIEAKEVDITFPSIREKQNYRFSKL